VSFASEPERDDGSLPPVNIVIPDDARELDRDVLAYHREIRALRRRQRRTRLLRPFNAPGVGGPAALVPLIALCLALALVGGALLSVLTISPAEQDTNLSPSATPRASTGPAELTSLPRGNVQLDGETKDVRSLASSAIALVPDNCGCGPALRRLTSQAVAAGAHVDFISVGAPSAQLAAETRQFGGNYAVPGDDADGVLANAYHPTGLTVLLVFIDGTAEVQKNLSGNFQLGLTPFELNSRGVNADPNASAKPSARPSAKANPTAGHSAG
jgi:hypothetical protein